MRLVAGLVVTAVLGAGLVPGGGASVAQPIVTAGAAADTDHLTPGPGGETTILDRETLFETAVDGDPDDYAASLYFVAEDGTWFHAFPNGTIGGHAPDGDEIPLSSGETYEVPPDELPTYLWKVVSDDECSTTFVDAENASDVAALPIPNCPPQTRPTPTPTAASHATEAGPDSGTPTAAGASATTPGQAGFGLLQGAVALLCAGWLVARHRGE